MSDFGLGPAEGALPRPGRWPLPFNRPLVWVAAAFVGGTYAASAGIVPGFLLPAAIAAAGLAVTAAGRIAAATRPVSVVLLAFGIGALLWNGRHTQPPGDPLSRYVVEHTPAGPCIVEGCVRLRDLELAWPDYGHFLLDVDRVLIEGEPVAMPGGVEVRWTAPGGPVHAGDRVRVRGRATAALSHVNPGVRTKEGRLRRMGIHTALRARGPDGVAQVARAPWWSVRHWASRMRVAQMERLRRAIPEEALPFALAVWLGYRGEGYERYLRSGTGHILAVSGLHMALVYVTASFMLRLFVRNRRWRALLVIAAIAAFALMAGLRTSVLRAALMLTVYMLAEFLDREPDAPSALSLAALLLLGWNPHLLFDGGFQLSFLSVGSLLLFADGIAASLEAVPRLIRGALATTLSVQILSAPVAIHWFHLFPLAAIPANLLILPLFTLALWLTFMTSVAAMVSSQLALLFGHALWPIVAIIRWIADAIASPAITHPHLTSPTVWGILAYWAAVACCARAALAEHRRRWLAAATVMAAATVLLWSPIAPEPEAVFLDVGHGDAAFLRSPGGATLLVDAGERGRFGDAGKYVVAPFLWANHVSRVDYLFVSHVDSDHVGGAFYVVEHFPVGQVFLSATASGRPLEKEFLRLCESRGVPVRRLHTGQTVETDGAAIEVLHPAADWPASASVNDASLVLRVTMAGTAILLTGDIEAAGEAAVVRTDCAADVLKVPHHGSRTSSSPALIAAVGAGEAVVSTGGAWGREAVNAGILARYRAHGARLWRTDLLGGVRLTFGRGGRQLQGERARRGYPCPPSP